MKLSHFFLPHPETHKKAHLISWQALLIYIITFLVLQIGLGILGYVKPGVLGIASNVDYRQLIDLTNAQRVKFNLPLLAENSALNDAAAAKAKNMFTEDYWAHFSPSGKDPWGFMSTAGYKFKFAGENLARNFYNSQDIVNAWMVSPTHKENIINPKYREIGIAVAEGTLKGQRTVLVVQMFGTPIQGIAVVPSDSVVTLPSFTPAPTTLPQAIALNSAPKVSFVAGTGNVQHLLIDPYLLTKNLGLSLVVFIASLILIDLVIIRRRGVYRLTSRHISHLALLSIGASALINMHPGLIL